MSDSELVQVKKLASEALASEAMQALVLGSASQTTHRSKRVRTFVIARVTPMLA